MLIDGAPVRFAPPSEAQRGRHRHDLPGAAAVPRAQRRREHLPRPRAAHAPAARSTGARCRPAPRELLASLEIHDLDVGRPVGALSVGNRQRVEIAKALSQNARILIMDEPTAALAEADVLHLFRIVRLLRARGVGIVYISHRLEEVFELADRVTVLRDGALVGSREVAATSPGELINLMVGRTIDKLYPKLEAEIGAPVLEVRGLDDPPLFHDVSLTVRAGEIVGLAGLVGSGRSELAQAIFGIRPPPSGEIRLEGQAVRIGSPGEAPAPRHRLRAGGPRQPGADPADAAARERLARGAARAGARAVRRPPRRARAGGRQHPPASRSARAAPSRSWPSSRAATSRRSC